jgi:hypothetical protein
MAKNYSFFFLNLLVFFFQFRFKADFEGSSHRGRQAHDQISLCHQINSSRQVKIYLSKFIYIYIYIYNIIIVEARDGLGLLDALKALRLCIVDLVKSARDANKYSVDVHQAIIQIDSTSKQVGATLYENLHTSQFNNTFISQFVEYVNAAAAERRSQVVRNSMQVYA